MLSRVKQAYSFAKDVVHEFDQDRGSLFAAAISFFALISLIPLALLAIGVFGYILGSEAALEWLLAFAKESVPVVGAELERGLGTLAEQSSLLGGLGLLGLFWMGSQVFVILQQVMNIALGAEKRVGFLQARGMALGMVVVAGALFALSIGITSMLTAVRHYQIDIWGVGTRDLEPIWDFFAILGPFLVSILAFTFIYKFLPARSIPTTGPMIGGVTAGLLFEAAKHAFRWYVTSIPSLSRIYGSLGGVVILVLWIYCSSIITIIGAEITSVYARREES